MLRDRLVTRLQAVAATLLTLWAAQAVSSVDIGGVDPRLRLFNPERLSPLSIRGTLRLYGTHDDSMHSGDIL